ncbi:glycosyltransferase family 2 protein [Xanthobacter sp. V2C-8]|uniref:glycosyltransferase family 2 protein n=1 Tax=Xanthobacter albus TaxID=3119929 RepID=UPI0037290C21
MINPFIPQTSPVPARASAGAVTLSICVPTRDRAPFLEALLPRIKAWSAGWDFSYEIVICDDCSTDATPDVVERFRAEGLPIRYFRQEADKGIANILGALHRAGGEYVVYLADDDLLVPEALADNIRFMQANPEIRACYTPWSDYDDVREIEGPAAYIQPDEVKVFNPNDETDLIGYIVVHKVFPEIAIYRADALSRVVSTPLFCHWSFAQLATIAASGPVAFRSASYYRSVTFSPVTPNHTRRSTEQALVDWDSYRGGLEYMVFSLLRRRNIVINEDVRLSFRNLIDHFVEQRMRAAMRLWLQRKDYVRAYEILSRVCYFDPGAIATFEHLENLPLLLTAQTLARFANAVPELERLLVAGVEDGQSLGQLLRDAGLDRRILVIPPPANPSPKNLHASLVFIGSEEMRQSFLDQGYAPGLIISERDIGASVLL